MKTTHLSLMIAFWCCTNISLWAQSNQSPVNAQETQERENCRTQVSQFAIDMEARRDQNAYRQLLEQQRTITRGVLTEYSIQIHIVTMDDGSGGIPIATIRNEFTNWVNPYFAGVNATFVECSPENYINSSTYFNLSGDPEGNAMSVANNVPNVINIYFVDDPDGACGWARFPWDLPSDYIVIANSCADNQSTLVHELGHYFSLYHTHETVFGAENVTRNNADGCYDCVTQGDKFCDTPADPTLSAAGVTISAAPACAYSSSLTDACGISYVPDPTLIMSYSRKACRTVFSASQKAKMTLTMASASGSPLFGRSYLQTACPCKRPVAICKNITVNLNAAGNASIDPSEVDNNSTFECGFDSWTVSPNSFDCGDVGNNTVTLTIVDDLGWESTCQAVVTVADVTNPTLNSPALNNTVECDGSGNTTDFANWLSSRGGATASDACGGSWSDNHTSFVYGCGGTGSQTVTFTYTDPSNNKATSTATFNIVDNTKPSLTCPDDIHLSECTPTASWTVNASDQCGNVTIVSNPPSGSTFPKGTTTIVNVSATDECSNVTNCSFSVTRDPDLNVSITPLTTSSLITCALGTNANIVLNYGGGPTCKTFQAIGSGGHGPYTYSWAKPAAVPAGSFTNGNTDTPTFCASFQTVACANYTFIVTVTDIHGCTETNSVNVSVINPACGNNRSRKIGVCHRPPGNPSNENSHCISSNAVNTHLYSSGHLDCLGGCNDVCISYSPRMSSTYANEDVSEKPYQISVQPNPFSSNTVIRITSQYDAQVKLTIVDYSGRTLAIPFEGSLQEGVSHSVDFDSGRLQPGMYIARLIDADGIVTHTTMVIVK